MLASGLSLLPRSRATTTRHSVSSWEGAEEDSLVFMSLSIFFSGGRIRKVRRAGGTAFANWISTLGKVRWGIEVRAPAFENREGGTHREALNRKGRQELRRLCALRGFSSRTLRFKGFSH